MTAQITAPTDIPSLPGLPFLGHLLEFHKRQLKLVAPPLQHRHIASYADIMVNYSDQIQKEWTEGQIINIALEMMRLTHWVVGRTLFDAYVLGEAEELGKALTSAKHH